MERRAARREPRNADYDALFELSHTPLVELDGAGVVLRINPAAARLLGTGPDAARGRALDDLLGVDVTTALATEDATVVGARTADGPRSLVLRSLRRTLQASDGERFTLQLAPALVDDDERDGARRGDPLHWTVMEGASHDLGTPLAIVRGYAETLASHVAEMSEESVADAAAAIHRHSTRAIDELHALQARVRLDAGGAGTLPASVLLAWLRRMLDANLVAANAALVGAIEVDQVTLDVAVARQALLNACTVVLEAEPRPRVLELHVTPVEEGTRFHLRPQGPDGAPTFEERASFTIEATSSLVTRHGGSYDPPTTEDPSQELVLPPSARAPGTGATPTIPVALIEDDPDTAALIRASLRASSALFRVVADERTFANGLREVSRSQPRIVLLDQHLPDRVGTDGIEELRAAAPGARIVVLSVRGRRDRDDVGEDTVWLEKGRVLADLGSELIGVMATTDD